MRLYLDVKIVDIVPRIGRTIIFKSELVEHEVRPTQGYERFAITTWFSKLLTKDLKLDQKVILKADGSMFVGIPAYRDPQLPSTLRSIVEMAS